MSNDYFVASGTPSTGSFGSSAAQRGEYAAIEDGFDKLPALSGNGSKIVAVNSGATALESIDTTGSGDAVRATSPTLVTPTLGVATATSINKVTITAPATSATLTLANGSSLITSGAYSVTLTATATTTVTLPTSGTLATLAGTETLTNKTLTSPTISGPTISGTPTFSGSSVTWSGNPTHSGNHVFSGSIRSQTSLLANRAGSNTGGSGPFVGVANAAQTRIWIWQLDASENLRLFYYNGSSYSALASVSSGGHLLLGSGASVEPWYTDYQAIQNGEKASWMARKSGSGVGSYYMENAYYDGAWKRQGTGQVALYQQVSGVHKLRGAVSGSGDSSISWLEGITVDAQNDLTTVHTDLTVSGDITGYVIGTDIQAYDADLAAIAALAKTDGNFIVGNGSAWVAESGPTAMASLGRKSGYRATSSSITNDDTLSTDSNFTMTLQGDSVYMIHGALLVQTSQSGATPGFRMQLSTDAAVTDGRWSYDGNPGAAAAIDNASPGALEVSTNTTSTEVIHLSGAVKTADPVTLTFKWAQTNSSAQSTTLYQGSWIAAERLGSV